MLKRRGFGQRSLGLSAGLAIGSVQPGGWLQALASELQEQAGTSSDSERVLVVIQLSGGNDGLNTVIPYGDENYAKARPKLAIPGSQVIKHTDLLGFHPSLKSLETSWSANRFSIVQGVGYAKPNRSHFESMDIWHTCHAKEDRTQSGWIGRWVSGESDSDPTDSAAIHLGSEPLPLACQQRGVQVPSLVSLEQMRLKSKLQMGQAAQVASGSLLDFVSTSTVAALHVSERLEKILAQPDTSGDFPKTLLGEKLRAISRLILAGVKTRVYYVTLDGFDTHANQPDIHSTLLRQWSEALAAFLSRLERSGHQDRVLVMTFSEFGRRVAENASQGTDHGAAAPIFLAGPGLGKLVQGLHPELEDLDDGDLRFGIDFRAVYAAVLDGWLKADSRKALDSDFRSAGSDLGLFT